jgi:hypothetical protein
LDIGRHFIRLPYSFDAERLADEANALPSSAWMAHPQRMSGNSAAALISRDGGDNDDFDGAMAETPHLKACPYARQVLSSFGEVLGRSRLMKLGGGAEVATHVDFNYHWYTRLRIHIPVITNPNVIFHCANQKTHMQVGECWIFDSWRRHKVTNGSAEDRVHLVIDAAGSSRFWNMVREMQPYDPFTDVAEIDKLVQHIPYDADKTVEIQTERYNISPVMSPGEVDALVSELLRDLENNPNNDPELVREYKILLFDFTKDWREIWHLHGYHREGWPRYQAAIDKVSANLRPNPRAVTTHSNDVGANPIIVQRILRSALAVDKMRQFLGDSDASS